jgi:RNA polymerase sigma factor (sigma-70 family)
MPEAGGRPTLDPDEDARLVELCRSGDAAAWAALIRRHELLVYAVARSYRLSPADAGDVFQEVFAALARGLPRIRDARALVRWLSSTTDRIARAWALRRRREMALGLGDDPTTLEELPSTDAAVGAELEELEARSLVRLALAALPPRCRQLLTALYYEDPAPSYTDLARRLGTPIGSLGPTRARCLERMREALERLEGHGPSEPGPPARSSAPQPDERRQRGITAAATPTSTIEYSPPGATRVEPVPARRKDLR